LSIASAYGFHRVVTPPGVMPQAAWRIDNRMECGEDEIRIEVEVLNVDSASFRQIKEEAGADPERMAAAILDIVAKRGKLHNPVTGSGGMLVGRVAEIGAALRGRMDLKVGDRIATLVSLSLTPLAISEIRRVDLDNAQVEVRGQAILFATGSYAKLPDDLPERVALALFDVCGAPALTARWVRPGDSVVILGAAGKAGLTVLRQARLSAREGRVIAIDYGDSVCALLRRLGFADVVLHLDATQPLAVLEAVQAALGGGLADVIVNCVNVPNTEMASILCVKEGGVVLFFSMATRFTAAALGAEGISKDVTLLIGNGYCQGHADHAVDLVRGSPPLLQAFIDKFA
jgi:L-erythro-3,5-diaminohexanoate dehydrogenase